MESEPHPIILLGRDHETLDAVEWRRLDLESARVEAVISRGGAAAAAKPNEDAALVLAGSAPTLVLVADGHYGAAASALALEAVASVYHRTAWSEPGARDLAQVLLRMVRASQSAILDQGGESETTLLVGLLADRVVHWASVGDSYLYRFPARAGAGVLNTPTRVWLGARLNVPVHEVTELGRCRLEAGTRLLLATDGIPEPVRGVLALGPPRIRTVLDRGGDRPLEALAREALAQGGEDNIAGVLLTGVGPG